MRSSHGLAICLVVGTVTIGRGVAVAQQDPAREFRYGAAFDPEQFASSADPDQIGLVDGARTQTRHSLGVGLAFHYAGAALGVCVRDVGASEGSCQLGGDLLGPRLRADLGVLYGFGRFDLRLNLPVVLHQSTDFAPPTGQPGLNSAGVAGPSIAGRLQLASPGPLHLAADLGIAIPSGGGNFIGDAGVIVDPRLLIDLRRGALDLGLNLGYRFRQQAVQVADLYVDDELTWSAAVQYWFVDRAVAVGAAAYGRIGLMDAPVDPMATVAGALGPEERPAEVLASLRVFITPKIAVDFGGGTALTSGYGAAPYRMVAGVRWIDRKPVVPRIVIADRDRDGLADADDACPGAAEDEDGFEDTDGCPEADNDGDGVADASDRCPTAAEDGDGVVDDDGCPETDADGDGLADGDDRCATEAEVFNDVEDGDGCPDAGRTLAFVEGDAVVITEKIFFDVNRARIKTRSEPVINAVASILKAHADLKIRIEGHTDDQGQADWNRTLSQLRAERVRDYLIARGIAASRLEAQGFGNDQPLMQGASEAARDKNRRVEFVITGRVDQDTAPAP